MGNGWDDDGDDYYDEEEEAEEKGYDENRGLKRLGIDPEMDPICRMCLIEQMMGRFELLRDMKKAGILEHGPRHGFKAFLEGGRLPGGQGSGLCLSLASLKAPVGISAVKPPPVNDNEQSDESREREDRFFVLKFIRSLQEAASLSERRQRCLEWAQELVARFPNVGRLAWLVSECFDALSKMNPGSETPPTLS